VQLFRRTSSNASNPTTQGISVRSIAGSGASRALVTLDGVPQNDPLGGWVIWSGLPPIGIEQAQIVRGAGAGPYGAGALTGVIQLSERTHVSEHGEYELYAGERGLMGAAAAAALGDVLVTASSEKSDGWIPVREGRLPTDQPLFFHASSAAIRWAPDIGGRDLAIRLSGYQEARGAGVAGGNSRALGSQLSMTLADTSAGPRKGWRLQGWVKHSDLENRTGDRASGLTTNEQYATPAWGAGANAAWRYDGPEGGWELGADARWADGETRERFGTGLAGARISGGAQSVAGLYAEGYREQGAWFLTGGARLDRWSTFDGHRDQTGIAPSSDRPADRDGWVPTARVGVRRDSDAGYVRGAAYAGFRPPTLNELYRPFALAGSTTQANSDLQPERLYGAELGVGGEGAVSWDVTAFYNQLDDAITNVTLSPTVSQRQNAGTVEAKGIEAQARRRWGDAFSLQGALGYTHGRTDSGLRPAQTPELTLSGAATWRPIERLSARVDIRYEGSRFDDDRNTRKLQPFTEIGVRCDWMLSRSVTLYAAAENLTDAGVQTARAFDGTISYDEPRTLRFGLILRP
jgi:outer membrane receptor protein involved in Fe transport